MYFNNSLELTNSGTSRGNGSGGGGGGGTGKRLFFLSESALPGPPPLSLKNKSGCVTKYLLPGQSAKNVQL